MTGGTSSITGTGRPSRPHAGVLAPTRATGQALCPGCATRSPHSCILTHAAPEGQRSRCCCGCVPYVEALGSGPSKPRERGTACERSQGFCLELQGRGATAEGGGRGPGLWQWGQKRGCGQQELATEEVVAAETPRLQVDGASVRGGTSGSAGVWGPVSRRRPGAAGSRGRTATVSIC